MKDKILEIIQKNYNNFKGTNEAELHSSVEIDELFNEQKIEIIKLRKLLYQVEVYMEQYNMNDEYDEIWRDDYKTILANAKQKKMKTIEQLEADMLTLKKQIEELKNKPTFEVGKWYANGDGFLCYTNKIVCKSAYGFGINYAGIWFNNEAGEAFNIKNTECRPATTKEVEDALIKEAVKRGFKEGVKYQSLNNDGKIRDKDGIVSHGFRYENNSLWCGWGFIFSNGQWAEIIKDETIKIGGYEVKFNKKDDLVTGDFFTRPLGVCNVGDTIATWKDNNTSIDGKIFTKEFWQAAKVISEHNKAKIMVGCSKQFDVSLETINAILAKL